MLGKTAQNEPILYTLMDLVTYYQSSSKEIQFHQIITQKYNLI